MIGDVEKIILICAFRYALGRQTYVVSYITEEIIRKWESIERGTRELIQSEIRQHESTFGFSEIDRKEWHKILDL